MEGQVLTADLSRSAEQAERRLERSRPGDASIPNDRCVLLYPRVTPLPRLPQRAGPTSSLFRAALSIVADCTRNDGGPWFCCRSKTTGLTVARPPSRSHCRLLQGVAGVHRAAGHSVRYAAHASGGCRASTSLLVSFDCESSASVVLRHCVDYPLAVFRDVVSKFPRLSSFALLVVLPEAPPEALSSGAARAVAAALSDGGNDALLWTCLPALQSALMRRWVDRNASSEGLKVVPQTHSRAPPFTDVCLQSTLGVHHTCLSR